jgi:DNA invertase Pin-like site-specific DNA recombinase
MLVGYMRVSTDGDRQVLDLQRDALLAAGVDERHLFDDRVSGSRGDRAGLARALAFIRPGDCLIVWKLDRLGRSLPHLLATVTDLKTRGIAFRSLAEQMDTTTPQRWRSSSDPSPRSEFARDWRRRAVVAVEVVARRRSTRRNSAR